MCEYCGCQALASIDQLTREHERVLALIGDVRVARRARDVTRQARLAGEIAAVLGPHTFVEEHGLFPALATDFPGHIAILEAEHRRIEVPLAEAVRAGADGGPPTDPGWPDRLAEALDLLRGHIFKEQDGVFPAALASLRTADWDAVDAARTAAADAAAAPQGAPGGE